MRLLKYGLLSFIMVSNSICSYLLQEAVFSCVYQSYIDLALLSSGNFQSDYCNKAGSLLLVRPNLFILQAELVICPVPIDAQSCNNTQLSSQCVGRKLKPSHTHPVHLYEFHMCSSTPCPQPAPQVCLSVDKLEPISYHHNMTFQKDPTGSKSMSSTKVREEPVVFLHLTMRE